MRPTPRPAAWAACLLGAALTAAAARADDAVYSTGFQGKVGGEWSHSSTDATPQGKRLFLGRFADDDVSLTLSDLPAHAFVTVSFELFIIDSWDGDEAYTGGTIPIGPDQWGLRVEGGPTLIHATFNNDVHASTRQSFPAHMGAGSVPAATGADERKSLGYRKYTMYGDAVYKLRYTFAHAGRGLKLTFYGLNLQGTGDESWGLDNVKVAVAPRHPDPPTDGKLADAWDDLDDADAARGERAVWTLAAAGDRAVALIARDLGGGPATAPAIEGLDRLIADLDSDDWQTRERATDELKRMGGRVHPALRERLARAASAEVRMRIRMVLDAGAEKKPAAADPKLLRRMRALRALELIGSDAAGGLAARIAGGPVGPAAVRPGARWVGILRRRGSTAVPAVLTVRKRTGDAVTAELAVGTDAGATPGKGIQLSGRLDDNRLTLAPGGAAPAPATGPADAPRRTLYTARILGRTLTGVFRGPDNAYGNFLLQRARHREP